VLLEMKAADRQAAGLPDDPHIWTWEVGVEGTGLLGLPCTGCTQELCKGCKAIFWLPRRSRRCSNPQAAYYQNKVTKR
jgi:hypothetical protein